MEITTENLIATFRTSGLTQTAFCKEHNITLERLRYFLYRKNKAISAKKQTTKKSLSKPAFVSFDKPPISIQDLPNTITIIHGNFTIKQVAALVSNLE